MVESLSNLLKLWARTFPIVSPKSYVGLRDRNLPKHSLLRVFLPKIKMKFTIQIDKRYTSLMVSILEDNTAIGWIALLPKDEDLIPFISHMIEKMNDKYKSDEIIATTKTTGDPIHSQ